MMPGTKRDNSLSTGEVVALTGVSERRLGHWARHGIVNPGEPGSGHPRRWTKADVRRIQELNRMLHDGLSFEVAAELVLADMTATISVAPIFEEALDDDD